MDSVSLQQFLALRQSAVERNPVAQKSATSVASGESWKAILESKRNEMGLQKASVQSAPQGISQNSQANYIAGDYRAKAESLRAQMQQGAPVRHLGSLFDVRA